MLATQNHSRLEQEFSVRVAQARTRSDELFDLLKPEFLYERPIAERHRLIFYLGHLEAFDWNLLRERLFGLPSFHAEFDRLFAFGIDPVDGGLPADEPSDWPSILEVREYGRQIRQKIDEGMAGAIAGGTDAADLLFHVAIEHRLMHAETITYLLQQLPSEQKQRRPHHLELVAPQAEARMMETVAGVTQLGLSRHETRSFGWDNEFEAQVVEVPRFSIDQHMVKNRQFLRFMEAGGYEDPSFWKDEDWKWKGEQEISHPAAWTREADGWNYLTMFDEVPLPLECRCM